MTKHQDETVFREVGGKARWLIQHIDELGEDERARLLAMVELDKDVGRELTDEDYLSRLVKRHKTHELRSKVLAFCFSQPANV